MQSIFRSKKVNGTKTLGEQQPIRKQEGYFLVEAMICILIIGILSAGLFGEYAKIQQLGANTQYQLQAVGIAHEIVDQLRAQPFEQLIQAMAITHVATIVGASPTGDTLFPRPMLRDTALTYYTNAAIGADDSQSYIHITNNQATVTLTGGNNGTIQATVTLQWSDENGQHTYTTTSVFCAAGLNG